MAKKPCNFSKIIKWATDNRYNYERTFEPDMIHVKGYGVNFTVENRESTVVTHGKGGTIGQPKGLYFTDLSVEEEYTYKVDCEMEVIQEIETLQDYEFKKMVI